MEVGMGVKISRVCVVQGGQVSEGQQRTVRGVRGVSRDLVGVATTKRIEERREWWSTRCLDGCMSRGLASGNC